MADLTDHNFQTLINPTSDPIRGLEIPGAWETADTQKLTPLYQVFDVGAGSHLEQPMFFGSNISTARYDENKIAFFEKQIEKQLSFFWRPEEIDLTNDRVQFTRLKPHERHIYLANLKYQTLLDSVQGRSPTAAFGSIVSLPELETWLVTWEFSETIHSRSYTHIMRNALPNPTETLDSIQFTPEIQKRAKAVTADYDQLIAMQNLRNVAGGFGIHTVNGIKYDVTEYTMKKQLVRTLFNVYGLEAIRFYVSFACSFQFAECDLMEGNAKVIKLIARDEILHKNAVRQIINLLRKSDDPIMQRIFVECLNELRQILTDVYLQEVEWIKYLFKDGVLLGLNERILTQYLQWLMNKAADALMLDKFFPDLPMGHGDHPLPWMAQWLGAENTQVSPQESEISSYLVGQIDSDLDVSSFSLEI